MDIKSTVRNHQQKIVIAVGYLLVALIAFVWGRSTAFRYTSPEIKIEQAFVPSNYSPNISGAQSTQAKVDENLNDICAGKIKGSSSLVYHLPGGAFYDRTTKPIRCFDTEAEAQAAGFRKASK